MEYLNFMLYLICVVYAYRKKCSLVFKALSSLWALCSFIGIFYYHSTAYKVGLNSLSLFPFLFLFVCWLICVSPFNVVEKKQINFEQLFKEIPFIKSILLFISISAYPVFIELCYILISSIFNGRIFLMAENYDDLANGYSDRLFALSKVSEFCFHIGLYFQVISPLLLLLYINVKKKNIFIIGGLIASSLIVPLYSICSGSRTGLVFFALYLTILYLFLYNKINEAINVKLRKVFIIGGSFFVSILIMLTAGRFVLGSNYDSDDIGGSLYVYTSESLYNFNTMASQTSKNTYGLYSFTPIEQRLGISPISNISKRRDYLRSRMDISAIWFYTFVGDFCIDFGYLGSFIIIILLSLIFRQLIKGKITLFKLSLIAVYLYIVSNGIFYFPFQSGDSALVGCLVIALIAFLSQKRIAR